MEAPLEYRTLGRTGLDLMLPQGWRPINGRPFSNIG